MQATLRFALCKVARWTLEHARQRGEHLPKIRRTRAGARHRDQQQLSAARIHLVTHVSLALHGLLSCSVFDAADKSPFGRTSCKFSARSRTCLSESPFRLAHPLLPEACGLRRGRSAPCYHRCVAAFHLSRCMWARHPDPLPPSYEIDRNGR
ncbi:hypothetical protein LDHU3_32.3270:CDS1 [Leishmania donovani]|uniref:Hypothetical_protein n=1 Tax=Leishmania donovani TaxID=5661 RepID=A0A3Q8IFK9_LEIDO|nr:hypothetical protein LdCL_320031800 [Leishmania donovani]CAJ1991794.1 hypothetical protein LDHU3_32.3270:CDS1 [Leishmania donovani]VDZ47633.1 hypothetical_protein [Leishmania donovani]